MTEIAHHTPADNAAMASLRANPLTGRFATPGDKAISHRALILGALAVGETTIEGLLEADDVMATAAALRQLGVGIEQRDGAWHVHGLGVGGLLQPEGELDLGNSGTGVRLLMGLLAPYNFSTRFTGGPTLTRRPMRPLLEALAPIGARATEDSDGGLPLTLKGPAMALPFRHVMAAPAEQIKAALLLAAAQIPGTSTIVEAITTSDHTEKLLADFGAAISVIQDDTGGATISLTGLTELRPRHLMVPGDPSAAAYAVVAGLTVPGSEVLIENVLINPSRTGLIDTLLEMGGDIQFLNQHQTGGEHSADLRVRSSRLRGITVRAEHAATMLDDIPALAMAAAHAHGQSVIQGLAALREQECDRLAATAAGLAASKVTVTEGDDTLTIGGIGKVEGGGTVVTRHDHRIAMSFLVLGMGSQKPVSVDNSRAIAASFPDFVPVMSALGGRFEPAKGSQT
jgi:3-phosphoshikimate 1-carboxyvinyltransferase